MTRRELKETMSDMPEQGSKLQGAKRPKSKSSFYEKIGPILVFLSIGLAFAVGMLWQKVQGLSGGTNTKTAQVNNAATAPTEGKLSEEQVKKIPAVTDADHIRGSKNAKVVLIEYSDLECPFCKRFHPTVKQITDEYDGQVAWVYRHFPLDQLHPKADKEAEAVECAAELGGEDSFWALVDKIYEVTPSNNGLDHSLLPGLAAEVGLSESAFKSCFDSGKYTDKIEEQYQGGITAGVSGTPGNFVLNSKGEAWLIPGALPYESVKATIEEALKS